MLLALLDEKKIPSVDSIVDINRHSDVIKWFRVTAFVWKFIRNITKSLRGDKTASYICITANEFKLSREIWIKANQLHLKSNEYNNEVKQLNISEDESGIIRMRGRLNNARQKPRSF